MTMLRSRQWVLWTPVALLAAVFVTAARPAPAAAISIVCPPEESPAKTFEESDGVITGMVRSNGEHPFLHALDPLRIIPGIGEEMREHFAMHDALGKYASNVMRVEVTDSWKGVRSREVRVLHSRGDFDSGELPVGTHYLFYLDWIKGEYFTHTTCSRTKPLSYAAEDLAFLDSKPTLTLGTDEPANAVPALLLSLLVMGIGLRAISVSKTRRQRS